MWLPPVGQHAADNMPVSKRIVAPEGWAKMHVRSRPADTQSALTWESAPLGGQCHR